MTRLCEVLALSCNKTQLRNLISELHNDPDAKYLYGKQRAFLLTEETLAVRVITAGLSFPPATVDQAPHF